MTRISEEIVAEMTKANVAAICTTERLATIFLQSLVLAIAIVPKVTEITANTVRISKEITKLEESINVIIPIVANFNEYPAKTTLPGQVASTCASGSQNESGKSGTFPITTSEMAAMTNHETDDEITDPAETYDEMMSDKPA